MIDPKRDNQMTILPGRLLQTLFFAFIFIAVTATAQTADQNNDRPRAREAGLIVGVFPPGPLNAITDVEGVRVGHSTVIEGDDIRTGVTAIIPGARQPLYASNPGLDSCRQWLWQIDW